MTQLRHFGQCVRGTSRNGELCTFVVRRVTRMVGGGEDGQIAEVKLHQPLVIDQNRLGLNYLLTKLFVQRTKFVNNLVEILRN